MDIKEKSWEIIDSCIIAFQVEIVRPDSVNKHGIFSIDTIRGLNGVRHKFQLTFYLKENDTKNFKVKLSRYDDIRPKIWIALVDAPPKFHDIPNWSIEFRINDIPNKFSAMQDRLTFIRNLGLNQYDNLYIDTVDNDIFENLKGLHYKQRIDT